MKNKIFKFKFQGKNYSIKNYTTCKNLWSQIRGLMFRPKNYKIPLLFIWNKPNLYPIHSFFCRKFIAVWILDDKIVEIKLVKPWENYVVPRRKFNYLLEVPL